SLRCRGARLGRVSPAPTPVVPTRDSPAFAVRSELATENPGHSLRTSRKMWTDPRGAARRGCAVAALSVLAAWLPTAPRRRPVLRTSRPLPSPAPHPRSAAPAADALLERLRNIEERLDRVTKQNQELAQENSRLA